MKRARLSSSITSHYSFHRSAGKRLSVTVDQPTVQIVKELQKRRDSALSETVIEILSSVSKGELKRDDLIAFYHNVWTNILGRPEHNILVRYSVAQELYETLYGLAKEVLGTRNASEMFRILVAFVGVKSGIVRVDWVVAAKLSIVSGSY